MNEIIRVENIKKYFPGVRAVDGVSMSIRSGEVHALIGENGAGKSTLVKLLTGVHTPTDGQIYVDGEAVVFRSPLDSQSLGITAIHQEASMFPNMTVTENIFIGHFPRLRGGLVDWKTMRRRTRELIESLDLRIPEDTLVKDLSIAQRHQIEIVKALSFDARVIIMDEPTSSLSLKEIEELYEMVRRLKADGRAIVFISHKFEEIFEITDCYTVLRDGRYAGSGQVRDTNTDELVHMMAGAALERMYPERNPSFGGTALEVESLSQFGVFEDISFSVRKGEIVGFFGLIGAGRSEVMQSVFGVRGRDSGSVRVDGAPLPPLNPRIAMDRGLALVPEDRQLQGVILNMSVRANTTLPLLRRVCTYGFVRKALEYATTARFARELSLRCSSYEQPVSSLSGGNQQKIVLSKWLATDPSILLLDEPTRGIDVGTKAAVHRFVGELADNGFAIVFVSSELHEVVEMSDRIVVMREGRQVAEFVAKETNAEQVLAAAIGASTPATTEGGSDAR